MQQRACEYLALSKFATLDVLATVLEEMPPFPEKESCGLLNLLKKKRPGRVPDNPEIRANAGEAGEHNKSGSSANATSEAPANASNNASSGSADLLGLGLSGSAPETNNTMNGNGFTSEAPVNNLTKYVFVY